MFVRKMLVADGRVWTEGLGAGDAPTLTVVSNGIQVGDSFGPELGAPLRSEAADRKPQPMFASGDCDVERTSWSQVKVADDCGGVGSPELVGEGVGDFGVLDDVGPVLEDPVSAGVLVVDGSLEHLGGVVEQLRVAATKTLDERLLIGRGGLEDLVEFGAPRDKFVM